MENFWAKKIYTLSGFAKEDILEGRKALDVGCGQRKLKGAVGLDIISDSQADVFYDIQKTPWPLEKDSFDLILLNHVLEHSDDVLKILNEVHRVLKPGGRAVIQVPYFRSNAAFADPTHKHFFNSFSLDYMTEGTKLSGYKYTDSLFRKIGFWYGWPHKSKNPFRQAIKNFVQKNPGLYDQYLSLIFPTLCLTWELEVIK